MVELVPILKSVRILNEKESRLKRSRIFASKMGELTLAEVGTAIYTCLPR